MHALFLSYMLNKIYSHSYKSYLQEIQHILNRYNQLEQRIISKIKFYKIDIKELPLREKKHFQIQYKTNILIYYLQSISSECKDKMDSKSKTNYQTSRSQIQQTIQSQQTFQLQQVKNKKDWKLSIIILMQVFLILILVYYLPNLNLPCPSPSPNLNPIPITNPIPSPKYIIPKYFNQKIQLPRDGIADILSEIKEDSKVLIFGLGYDSQMWLEASKGNILFVQNDQDFIKKIKGIPSENIIKYLYQGITVKKSFNLTDDEIKQFQIPQKLLTNAPFDVILIDAPPGYAANKPGRLLPTYWSINYLSKPGSRIYLHDVDRELQKFLVQKYVKRIPTRKFFKDSGILMKFVK